MNKKALSLAICAALTVPTLTGALSLGEIESNSHLNQPFRGKIDLLSTNVAEAKNLRVRIASPAVFNRVGIDRPAFLNSIRFRTTIQNGKPVILVSSNQPINEPFLNFLLEISWPNGQLLKEYTVLLDPPVLITPNTAIASNRAGIRPEPKPQVRVTPARTQNLYRQAQQQARRVQQPRRVVRAAPQVRRPAPPVRRAPTVRRVAAAPVRSYRVRRGDSLYKVAKKLGYRGATTEQMVVALFEKNKKAFHKNNMNNLKVGAVLQRPSLEHAKSITRREAKSTMIAQARAWKKARATLLAKKSSKTSVAAKKQARIEVVGKVDASKVAALAASGKASVNELRKQLTLTSEALTSRQKENQELKSRVAEMESLLRKKNTLISMKSKQLAQLQSTLSGKTTNAKTTEGSGIETAAKTQLKAKGTGKIVRPKVKEDIVTKTKTKTKTTVDTAKKEDETVLAKLDKQKQAAEAKANESIALVKKKAADAKKALAAKAKKDVEPESAGIMGLLDSPDAMKYGLGGGAALALLGGFMFMRRRKNTYKEFSADDYAVDNSDESLNDELTSIDTDSMIDESEFVQHDHVTHDDVEHENKKDNDTVTSDAEDDLLQEADVYIVYGLHDQAESELQQAISKDPQNLNYRKKLLENYKAAGNKEAFEKEAQAFIDLDVEGKEKHWDEIKEWGGDLNPDSSLFNASALTSSLSSKAAAAGVAMVAGTAIAQDDNKIDLEDLLDTNELASNELEDIDLDEILVEDIDEDDLIENIEGLDLSEEMSFDDFEVDGLDDDLDDTIETVDLDSLDSLLDEATETASLTDDSAETKISDEFDMNLETANLNLDVDSKGFDKIMPKNHAYKSESDDESFSLDQGSDNNLLADVDDNLAFLDLDDSDVIEETQIGTKIDLAKAYIDMGDIEGARSTLEEVMQDGSDEQKLEAEELLLHTG